MWHDASQYIVLMFLHGKLHHSCMVVKHNHSHQTDTDHQSIQMGMYTESHWLDPVKQTISLLLEMVSPFSVVESVHVQIIYICPARKLLPIYFSRHAEHRYTSCAYSATPSVLARVWITFIDVSFTSAPTKPSSTEAGVAAETILQNSRYQHIDSKQYNIYSTM